MYKKTEHQLTFVEDFFLPFGGKLNKENRWVRLAELIPWWKAEEKYAKSFKKKFKGEKAYSVRVALGALYIKERLGLSDRETVEQITENPYLQYFIGLPEFQEKAPFDHSLMTRFRKRLRIQLDRLLLKRRTKESSFWTQPVHRLILLTLLIWGF